MQTFRIFALFVLIMCFGNAAEAAIVLDLDDSTFRTSNGTDYEVDARIIVNDIGDPDLTNKTQISGVNLLFTFDTVQPGVEFVGIKSPPSDPLFTNASYAYVGDLPAYLFGSVSSNASAADPFLDNRLLLSLQFRVPSDFSGIVEIIPQQDDVIFNSGPATFFTTSSGRENFPFDSLSGARLELTTVPEPSGMLFATGGLCWMLLRRRRKSRPGSGDKGKSD